MSPPHVDALLAVVGDGVAFDGLRVGPDGEGGYRFETPETERRGLDESTLRSLATCSPAVSNWHFWHAVAPQREDHWTFLRWLEGLDGSRTERHAGRDDSNGHPDIPSHYERLARGVDTTWGQLRVTASLAEDGRRAYSLRHVADVGENVDPAALELLSEPRAARDLARFDDRGRYRPLKTAPTFQRGWRFADLDAETLLDVLGYLYPATVENWYRERTGTLNVTHWQEAIDRQTGISGVVETWNRGEGHDHVERVAETCCVDVECLKRREWEYDEETTLDVEPGEGAFPCREPCSMVVSAARTWTRIEGEETETYEFDLTPTERAQLETIVDAVADGRTADIREAAFEDGANRWRARYLRARRFDDDGESGE